MLFSMKNSLHYSSSHLHSHGVCVGNEKKRMHYKQNIINTILILLIVVLIYTQACIAASSKTIAGTYRHLTELDIDASNLFLKDVRGGGCADPKTGDLFICDDGQFKVFKISASTNIATHFAGNGYQSTGCTSSSATSPCGNNIKATEAGFRPHTCAVDPVDGSVYILDYYNSNIKKVNQTTGIISLFYGNGLNSLTLTNPHTIAVSSSYIYIMEDGKSSNNQIRKIDRVTGLLIAKYGDSSNVGYQGDGGLISSATVRFQTPGGVAVSPDGLYVYISDKTNEVIRRWNTQTNMIELYAGTPLTRCTSVGSACGDGGSALSAILNYPQGMTVLPNGDLIFSDSMNCRIRKIDFLTGIISTVIGSGNQDYPSNYYFSIGPNGDGQAGPNVKIYVSNDEAKQVKSVFNYGNTIYYTEMSNRLRQLKDGIVTCKAGTHESLNGFGNKMINTQFKMSPKVAWDNNNTMFVMADTEIFKVLPVSNVVKKVAGGYYDPNTAAISPGAGGLALYSQIYKPKYYMVIDQTNNDIYFTDDNYIKKIDAATGVMSIYAGGGASYATNVLATATKLDTPKGIALTPSGDLLIAVFVDRIIRKVSKSTGIITTIAGIQGTGCYSGTCGEGGSPAVATFSGPQDIVVASNGDIFISDTGFYYIRKISGNIITKYAGTKGTACSTLPCGDGGLATSATLGTITDLAIHPITGELYMADANRIRKISTSGIISTVVGTGSTYVNKGEWASPLSMSISAKRISFSPTGTLYFDDLVSTTYTTPSAFTFSAIRYLDSNGYIATASGHYLNDYSFYNGENVPALKTKLMRPSGLFIDSNNDIYIGAIGGGSGDSELFSSSPSMNYARIAKYDSTTGLTKTILGNFVTATIASQVADNTYAFQAALKIQDTYKITGIQFPFGLFKSPTTGEFYYSESDFNRIRKIDSNNRVITVAGTSTACTPASGVACGDNGAPLSATLNYPTSIFIVGTKIYFADTMNHRIRMIDNNVISTVIGEGTECATAGSATCDSTNPLLTKLSKPTGLFVSADGSIYVADTGNHKIRKLSSGSMSIVAGSTSSCSTAASCGNNVQADGTSAKLYYPTGVTVDETLNEIYIADQGTQTIRKVSSNVLSTYAGTFTLFSATTPVLYSFEGSGDYVSKPVSVWYSNLGIYYTESKTGRVRMLYPSTCPVGKVGMGCNIDGCNAIPTSSPLVCSGHGVCNVGTCDCNSGYSGTDCQVIDYASSSPSSPVISQPTSYSCFSISSSNANVCSGRGTCTSTDSCSCQNGYSGSDCSMTSCYSVASNNTGSVCSGKGSCSSYNQCQCQSNYIGSDCSVTSCNSILSNSSLVCYGRGSCSSYNQCACNSNYLGNNCEISTCGGVRSDSQTTCSSHGSCVGYNQCQCQANYYGSSCELTTCSSVASNDSNVCSGKGSCSSYNQCQCQSNYAGSNCNVTSCSGVSSNDSNVCSGKGSCYSYNQCQCHANYNGDNCEVTTCSGISSNDTNVCSGKGSCLSYNQCQCHANYHGDNCEVTTCSGIESNDTNVCSGKGSCQLYDQCKCQSNYIGSDCSVTSCNSILSNSSLVCSGRGSCSSYNQCQCQSNYIGSDCSVTSCNSILSNTSLVCSGKGLCLSYNQCQCQSNYHGDNCEVTTCSGISSNDTNVCSGKGSCLSYNQCQCQSNYLGSKCDVTICNNLFSNDSQVCSGNGVCSYFENCNCNVNYYGDDCSVTMCNGVMSNSTVCSRHGTCSSFDTCLCNANFFGNDCQLTTCFQIQSNDTAACSSHGTCSDFNSCVCETGYHGPECAEYKCNGTLNTDPHVCNGNGSCIATDVCNCTEGYFGQNCENHITETPSIPESSNTNNVTNSSSVDNSTAILGNETLVDNNSSVIDNSTVDNKSSVIDNSTLNNNQSIIGDNVNGTIGVTNDTLTIANETSTNETLVDHNNTIIDTNATDSSNLTDSNSTFGETDNTTISDSTNGETDNTTISDSNSTLSNSSLISNESSITSNETLDGSNNTTLENSTLIENTTETTNSTLPENATEITNSTIEFNSTDLSTNETISNTTELVVSNSTLFQNETALSSNVNNITLNNSTVQSANSTANNTNSTTPSSNKIVSNETITPPPSITKCTKEVTCSNHGECNYKGYCTCFASQAEGYWNGSSCDTCQTGFFGEHCATKIVGPVRMTSDFRGVDLYLFSPPIVGVDVTCTRLLHAFDLSTGVYGTPSLVKCQFVDKTSSLFRISFGSMDYKIILSISTIRLNTLAFNLIDTQPTNYVSFVILPPLSIAPPQSIIKMSGVDMFSSCDEISVDGSNSFSADGKSLIFTWTLFNSNTSQPTNETIPNQATILLSSSLAPGFYYISLSVKSSYLGITSSTTYSNVFTKSSKPLPSLNVPKSVIEKYSNEFPVTLKKTVTNSSCQSNDVISIEWIQTGGPSIAYQIDTAKNLVIPKLIVFGTNSYVFKVSAFYSSDPTNRVSSQITLNTRSPELNLELHILQSTTDSSTIEVEYSDPEAALNTDATESWSWNCTNNLLNEHLLSVSNSKSTIVIISTNLFKNDIPNFVDFTLTIVKSDGRSVSRTIRAYFTDIPPVVNVVSIDPETSYVLSGKIFSMQTLVSTQSTTVNTWKINGETIGNVAESGASTTIAIDTSLLPEGSTNDVQLSSYDSSTGATSTTTYTFQVATTPKPCLCDVTPTEGTALETNFRFACINCQNSEKTIDFNYGFVDDRSGAKISLYNLGEIYSSKIPSPASGTTMRCYIDIVDTTTGASTTSYYDISIFTPVYSNVQQIEGVVQGWTDESVKMLEMGDFSKSIFQSASVSRTNTMLVKEYIDSQSGSRRSIDSSCKNGVEVNGVCQCTEGYVGNNCDISIVDFQLIQTNTLSTLKKMVEFANITGITDDHVSLMAFGLDSMLLAHDSLNPDTMAEVLNTLKLVLDVSLNSQLKVDLHVLQLFDNCVKSAYTYLSKRRAVSDQAVNSLRLMIFSKLSNYLTSRDISLGSSVKNKKLDFYSANMNRYTLYDYETKISDPNHKTSVHIESSLFSKASKIALTKKPFSVIMTSMDDVYETNSKLAVLDQFSSKSKASSVVSNILSLNIIDNTFPIDESGVIYTIPVKKTSTGTSGSVLDLEIITTNQSYMCADFTDSSAAIDHNCFLLSITDTEAVCKCNRFTNVFIVETISKERFSLSNYVIFGVAIYILLCVVIAAAIAFCCIIHCLKRRKRRVVPITNQVQDISYQYPDKYVFFQPAGIQQVQYPNKQQYLEGYWK